MSCVLLDGDLAIRPSNPGPLFVFSDSFPLSRSRLTQSICQVLSEVGVDCSGYSGHSFRIGAATTAARLGVSDSLIKTLGLWKSSAFMLYILTPWQRLAQVSSLLVTPWAPLVDHPSAILDSHKILCFL